MRCHECGGVLVESRVQFEIETSNYGRVIVTDVPGKVCQSCGSRLFPYRVAERLEEIRDEIECGKRTPIRVQRPPDHELAFALA